MSARRPGRSEGRIMGGKRITRSHVAALSTGVSRSWLSFRRNGRRESLVESGEGDGE